MNLVKKKLEELKLSEYNPRRMREQDLQRLQESIMKFGYVEPIVWNKRTGRVVGGHQRLKALQNLGVEEVEVVEVDLDEGKEKALNLALNKIQGEWDEEKLSSLLTLLKKEDENILPYTGFNDKELAKIIKSPLAVVEDEIPETRETNIKTEDKFLLGDHVLLCGDATNPEHVKLLMDGEKADMVFTDPPYAIYGSSTGFSKMEDDEMVKPFFLQMLKTIQQNTVLNGHIYIFCNWKSFPSIWNQNKRVGLSPKNVIVWHKPNARLGAMYSNSHEFIFFLANEKKQKYLTKKEHKVKTITGETNVWTYTTIQRNRLHFAIKPIEMAVRAIKNSTVEGETVLDLFGGSGTTLIACEQTGRKCKMMEISPEYCQVIIDRWEKLTGKKAQKVN